MYWNQVLQEVLNKDSAKQPFLFTSIIENKKKQKRETDLRTSTVEGRVAGKGREGKIYLLGARFNMAYFTKREAECMLWLLKGRTINRVAAELGLSPRTVEFYLKNMKTKLGCRTKFELIDLVRDSEFMDHVDFE